MPISTAFTRLLEIRHPIVSAPMAGAAGGALAAAVSRAGGLGLIGGGYGDAEFLRREFGAAAGAPVGCGFITWSLAAKPELLTLALSFRPVAVMLSFGDPAPFTAPIRAAGARLLCQVGDRAQALAALAAGADVLVAQGRAAGGHGCGERDTITLVPEIVDLVAAHGLDTPVLAAGGIADGRGLAAALLLGAAGVLCGTRFYAADEALTTSAVRAAVAAADGDGTCRTGAYDTVRGHTWPQGQRMRVLRNDFTDRWADPATPPDAAAAADYRRAVAADDVTIANVTAGEAAGLIGAVEPAGAIVAALAADAARLLRR